METIYTKFGAALCIDGVHLLVRGTGDFKANPTIEAGDVMISKDGSSFVSVASLDPAAEVSVTPTGGTAVRVLFDESAIDFSSAIIRFVDQTSPKEWDDARVRVLTYGHANAWLKADLGSSLATSSEVGAVATAVSDQAGDIGTLLEYTTQVKDKTARLPNDPASNTQVNTRLAASGYTAPDNAGILSAIAALAIPTSAQNAAAVLASLVDGIALSTVLEVMLAVLSGVDSQSGNTITFKKRNGSTGRIQFTIDQSTGLRTASEIL